jgi:hypothetical protein
MENKNWSTWLNEQGTNISEKELNEMSEKGAKDLSHMGLKADDLKLAAKEHQKKLIKKQNEGVMENLNEVL